MIAIELLNEVNLGTLALVGVPSWRRDVQDGVLPARNFVLGTWRA